MDVADVLGIALTAAALVLVGVALYALFAVMAAVKELREAVEDVRSRLVPLLDKADVTLDAANAELLRLDGLVSQVENVGDVMSSAGEFIRSPVSAAAGGLARIARSFKKR